MKNNYGWLYSMLLLWLLAQSFAVVGETRRLEDVKASKDRFISAATSFVNSYQIKHESQLSKDEKSMIGAIKFDYLPDAMPAIQRRYLYGQARIMVTDGWMALFEVMARLEVSGRKLKQSGMCGGQGCSNGQCSTFSFMQKYLSTVKAMRESAQCIGSKDAKKTCKAFKLLSPAEFNATMKDRTDSEKRCFNELVLSGKARTARVEYMIDEQIDVGTAWFLHQQISLLRQEMKRTAVPDGLGAKGEGTAELKYFRKMDEQPGFEEFCRLNAEACWVVQQMYELVAH